MTTDPVAVPGGHLHLHDEGDPSGPALVLIHAAITDRRARDGFPTLIVDFLAPLPRWS